MSSVSRSESSRKQESARAPACSISSAALGVFFELMLNVREDRECPVEGEKFRLASLLLMEKWGKTEGWKCEKSD